MDITGKIEKILDIQKFTSKKDGSEICKYSFVLVTDGQYPKRVCMTVMTTDRWQKMSLVVGLTYNVSFDIDAREWNGKWYNEISAWRAVPVDVAGQSAQPAHQEATAPSPQTKADDDLPF